MTLKKIRELLDKNSGSMLAICFFAFAVLSWILLFRDGRGLYTFVRFYPFLDPFVKQGVITLNKLGLNLVPTVLFAGVSIASFYLYVRSLKQNIDLRATIKYSIIFQLITYFLSYPILAKDIFYYIFSDRVMRVYHTNIWKVPVNHFTFDKFSWTDWQLQVKAYGGVNQFFYNFASAIGGNDLILSLFSYKGLTLIFSILTMILLYKILKKRSPGKEALGLRLLFWNPLFILEIIGAGHNDILMIFFAFLSFYFLLNRKALLSGISLALSTQVKIVTIFILPFTIINFIREKRISEAFYFLLGFTVTDLIVFKYMDVNPIEFTKRVLFNLGVYWQSLPNLVYQLHGEEKLLFTAALIIVAGIFALYQFIKRENPFIVFSRFMFTYLLFFTSAYWNWYVLWSFFLVPFIQNKIFKNTLIIFTFTSLMAYPLYWLSLRFSYQSHIWPIVTYLFIFGVPMVSFIYLRAKKSSRSKS